MNNKLSRSAATASAGAAVISRLFYGLMVDAPEVHNGAWLSALLGLILSLPVLWLICRAAKRGRRPFLLCALLVSSALDAAGMLEATAFSESCVAFNHIPTVVLMLPLLLAVGRCLWLGGDALGASARVWMRAFVPLMLVVILYQWPYYRPAWLFPALGFGMRGVLHGSLRAAGWIVIIGGAAVLLCGERQFKRVCGSLSIAVAVVGLLILLRLMMAPVMDAAGLGQRTQLDALLTNGRAPMYLQLPMIIIYCVGMLHLLCFESWAASALLQRVIPQMSGFPAGILTLSAVALMALLPSTISLDLWRLPVMLIAALVPFGREAAVCDG